MSDFKDPIEKLPLNVRKQWRDEFEAHVAAEQAKLAALVGVDSYTFHADPKVLHAYAEPRSWAENHPGSAALGYFQQLINAVSTYTKDGKDAEAVGVYKQVASKNSATIVVTEKYYYCGLSIEDGEVKLHFNPKFYTTNMNRVGENFAKEVDAALDGLDSTALPVATRRSIQEHLDPKIVDLKARVEKLFGKPYTFEYDVGATLKKVSADSDNTSSRDWPTTVPRWIASYFENAVKTLEDKKFGEDDMLQEAFTDAADKNIIRFEIVDTIPNGRTYHDAIFENGEFKVVTTTKWFGTNMSTCAEKVTDRL